ncbi:MAG: hypothetical protein K9M45_03555 [Kiritimatiellales bacterium]|nr:hypothetical protein [Kiritimatiellales bacterium]
MKRKLKSKQKLIKGTPSAVVLSFFLHAVLLLLAGLLGVFTITQKEEKKFVPPKPVERPKMRLRKPKVKVKKTAKPKPTTRIVTKVNRASMPDIQLPEMSGMQDGIVGGIGGFELMPDMGEVSLFGGGQTIGNDFEGTLYHLLHDRRGGLAIMDRWQFQDILRKYARSGFSKSKLARYYRSPMKLYTTHFMIPPIVSPVAPDVFGAPELESYFFFINYEGQLVYPEDIKFRFWGMGDAYVSVFVDGEHVLLNGWDGRLEYLDYWQPSDADSDKYFLGNQTMHVGDWIELKAGEPKDMEVFFGEWVGGQVAVMLLVEVEGEEYPQTRQGGPLLPAFKTSEFSRDQLEEIYKYLPAGECSLTNGPVFRDYVVKGKTNRVKKVETVVAPVVEEKPPESKTHIWTSAKGIHLEAEFVHVMGDKVVLKLPRGNQKKFPLDQFSEEDHTYIELQNPPRLDVSVSRKTEQRVFPESLSDLPSSTYNNFTAVIKQGSSQPYNQDLEAELFIVGEEKAGDHYIFLDYQKTSFRLTEGSASVFKLPSRTIELVEFAMNGQLRGEIYTGYMVIITDSRGKVIAHKETRDKWFDHVDNLRNMPIGKTFDDECNRCWPTRPKRWY